MPVPPSIPADTAPRWIAVALVLRPQGRVGEVLADPLSDQAELFTPGQVFRVVCPAPHAGISPVTLESVWRPQGRKAGRLVLKLAGVDSISDAEQLEGAELQVQEKDLPALDEGTFLVRDLVGCLLLDGERPVGTVVDLQFPVAADGRTRLADAPDLLVIRPHARTDSPGTAPSVDAGNSFLDGDEGDVLVPFVKAWLTSVDLPAKQLRMHLPAGLFD